MFVPITGLGAGHTGVTDVDLEAMCPAVVVIIDNVCVKWL
jgi:hypothetical protein